MISERTFGFEPAAAAPGLRERRKSERRRRVLEAAREVFLEHGYEHATTREIATRAGVAVGTVFVYARDKRDLLMTIVNDDLEALTEASLAKLDPAQPFLDRLIALFEPRYRYWVRDPEISTVALTETAARWLDDNDPSETARFLRRRLGLTAKIAEMVEAEQRAGRLGTPDDPPAVALFVMGIYLAHVRFWLGERNPQVAEGIARLRRQLRLAMAGLAPNAPPA
jgi:AcrR family transcriptional regulator